MNEQAREARRTYKREWNRKNPDKVKAAQARYWERKAQAARDAQESADKPNKYEEAQIFMAWELLSEDAEHGKQDLNR